MAKKNKRHAYVHTHLHTHTHLTPRTRTGQGLPKPAYFQLPNRAQALSPEVWCLSRLLGARATSPTGAEGYFRHPTRQGGEGSKQFSEPTRGGCVSRTVHSSGLRSREPCTHSGLLQGAHHSKDVPTLLVLGEEASVPQAPNLAGKVAHKCVCVLRGSG